VREPVRFHDVVRTLADDGVRVFLELGADSSLTPMVEETLTDAGAADGAVAAALLRRQRPEVRTLLTSLARAYTAGVPVDWAAFFAGPGARPGGWRCRPTPSSTGRTGCCPNRPGRT
jgi:acyl transferase domain-containing protein